MKITKELYVTNRKDWRVWLEKNHQTEKEVWLIFYKTHTGKTSISYGDAVEEALCYGWIDSIIRKIDEKKFTRKFTPRKDKSNWSELNKKRAIKMMKERKMTKAGLIKIKDIFKCKEKSPVRSLKEKPVIPDDIKKAFASNKRAWENFSNFAPSYQKLYIGWISDARWEETRKRRIEETIKLAAQNIKHIMK